MLELMLIQELSLVVSLLQYSHVNARSHGLDFDCKQEALL